jgi:hypothetical protein
MKISNLVAVVAAFFDYSNALTVDADLASSAECTVDLEALADQDYSGMTFQERLKAMCAAESENGVSSIDGSLGGSNTSGGWDSSSAPKRNRSRPPRRPRSSYDYGSSSSTRPSSSSSSSTPAW